MSTIIFCRTLVAEEIEVEIKQCGTIGCFEYNIDYEIPMGQIEAILQSSLECQQEISFECFSSPLQVNSKHEI